MIIDKKNNAKVPPKIGAYPFNGIYYDLENNLYFIKPEDALQYKIPGSNVLVFTEILGIKEQYNLTLVDPKFLFGEMYALGKISPMAGLFGTKLLYVRKINNKPVMVISREGIVSDGNEIYMKNPKGLDTKTFVCDGEEMNLAPFPSSLKEKLENFYVVYKCDVYAEIKEKNNLKK